MPAIDVEIADEELAADPVDVGRASRIQAAGQGIGGAVGDSQAIVQILRLEDGQDRAEDFLLGHASIRLDVGDDHRADEVALIGERSCIRLIDHAALGGGDPLVFENAPAGVGVDHRADQGLGIVGRPHLDRPGRLD